MHRSSTVYKRKQSKQTCSFSLHKVSVDGLEWCGILVDYCDVFISCLDSYSDGTHSMQRIHWWTSDAILHFSKSVQWRKNSYIWIKAWGSTFSLSVQILGSTFPLTIYIYRIFYSDLQLVHQLQFQTHEGFRELVGLLLPGTDVIFK